MEQSLLTEASVLVNFRILPGETSRAVIARVEHTGGISGTIVAPYLLNGRTNSCHFQNVAANIYRFAPYF